MLDEHDAEWIRSLICLKRCGMSIEEMHTYMELCLAGKSTIEQRKAMLAQKRARLLEQMEEIRASIDYIDWKQGFCNDVLAGRGSTAATS